MAEPTWDDLSPLEKDVLYFICEMCTVSYINLHRRFPKQFPGKAKLTGRDKDGTRSIFWDGISQRLAAVLTKLRREKIIHMTQCRKEVYLHDLSLFATDPPPFLDDPTWLPIVYDATERGKSLIRSLDGKLLKQLMEQEVDYQLKLHTGLLDANDMGREK